MSRSNLLTFVYQVTIGSTLSVGISSVMWYLNEQFKVEPRVYKLESSDNLVPDKVYTEPQEETPNPRNADGLNLK